MAVPGDVTGTTSPRQFAWRLAEDSSVGLYGFVQGRESAGCLSAFLKLSAHYESAHGERPERALNACMSFARKWGVLGPCAMGVSGAHAGHKPKSRRVTDGVEWFFEDVQDWTAIARHFEGLLSLAMIIQDGDKGTANDWSSIHPFVGELMEFPDLLTGESISIRLPRPADRSWDSGERFSAELHRLIRDAGLAPAVRWDQEKKRAYFTVELGGPAAGYRLLPGETDDYEKMPWPAGSLYPVLVAQLVAAALDGRLVRCSRCDTPYDYAATDWGSGRQPRFDRSMFCSRECRDETRREQKAKWIRNSRNKTKEARDGR